MGEKFALLIGCSQYDDAKIPGLKTPSADVLALEQVLKDKKIGGFEQVISSIDQEEKNVRIEIATFFAKKKSDDLLLFYFTGHGVLDDTGSLYFALKDTKSDIDVLPATAISASYIRDAMKRCNSQRQIIILDCCNSGAFGKGGKGIGSIAETRNIFFTTGKGRVVITATDSIQRAWEGEETKGEPFNSVFTKYLVDGLRTGKADQNKDGIIDINELYSYVFENVRKKTSKQTPGITIDKAQGVLAIANNPFLPPKAERERKNGEEKLEPVEPQRDLIGLFSPLTVLIRRVLTSFLWRVLIVGLSLLAGYIMYVITAPGSVFAASYTNRILYVVLAAFLTMAIVLVLGIASILLAVNFRIRTQQDVFAALHLPVFSTIGLFKENGLVMWSSPFSIVAEDFRMLGNKIRLLTENSPIKTILITSPVSYEGKSTVCSNLGIVLCRMGLRVVVVDADMHLPRIHKLFGLAQASGLADSLRTGNINGSLQATGLDELKILTSGGVPINPAELLSSPNLEKLLQELKRRTDLVLIDCPPVLAASDASILAPRVDGVLLVLRAGFSESKTAQEALEALVQVKAKVVGVMLNSVPTKRHF
jgi:capsular exopolysaccharide synthesis family protein